MSRPRMQQPPRASREAQRPLEIDTPAKLEESLARGSLAGTIVQGLDLVDADLDAIEVDGAVLLGCALREGAAPRLLERGALLFPALPALPYDPYRPRLYTADELMAGYRRGEPDSFADTLDQAVYRHNVAARAAAPTPLAETLAQRLHDHAIDDALDDLLHGPPERRVVAIMGGHAMKRDEPAYAAVARIARRLARHRPSFLMASGGGPGAMEATHLGAHLAGCDDDALDSALSVLSVAPGYRHSRWLDSAFEVRERWSDGAAPSLGIPTWFYGNEPPNVFATHIAKYFSNSLREDGLLAIARHGVVYAPGSAGTIQEVFMDAAQNHYGTFGVVSPMVFFGERYWRDDKPVYPLLQRLAADKQYGEMLFISDDVDAIADFIVAHPPRVFR